MATNRGEEVPYLDLNEYNEIGKLLLEKYGISGIPAVLVVKEGELVEYLYAEEWVNKGLADSEGNINLDVINEFFEAAK